MIERRPWLPITAEEPRDGTLFVALYSDNGKPPYEVDIAEKLGPGLIFPDGIFVGGSDAVGSGPMLFASHYVLLPDSETE